MKKTRPLSLLLLLFLTCALLLPARADVLWEPIGNRFYDAHYEECEVVDRTYYVPEGSSLNLYQSPENGTVLKKLTALDRIYVNQSLEWNGELWAVGYPKGDYETEGWFRLGRLQLEYDHQCFCEDYSDTFTDYAGQLDGYQIQNQIYSWTYPGSGISDRSLEEINLDYSELTCQSVYTDPEGGQWGYVGYYMGRFGWVYLDDPENPEPPAFPQQAESTVTEAGPEATPSASPLALVFVLVALVAAVTAVLLWRMKKAQKR